MRMEIRLKARYIRHRWPEKPGLSIYRPNGIDEYLFLHLWNPFKIRLNEKTIITKPHACLIYHNKTPQIYSSKEASTQDWFRMSGDVEEILAKYGLETNKIYYPKNYSFITSLTRKMELECAIENKYHTELCNSHLNNLFIQLSREISSSSNSNEILNSQTKEQLKKLRSILALEYDKKWNIADMATAINLSPSYLHATYKKYYGISPLQDLINIRIHQATILLTDDKKSISEISETLGYPSPSQFIRQFTKTIGISPLKYRNFTISSADKKDTH